MENLMDLLKSYTYDSTKKVSWMIVKKIQFKEDLEEEVIKQKALIEKTFTDPLSTLATNQILAKVT